MLVRVLPVPFPEGSGLLVITFFESPILYETQTQALFQIRDYVNFEKAALFDNKLKQQNTEMSKILEETSPLQEQIHNQNKHCSYWKNTAQPSGCRISMIPRPGKPTAYLPESRKLI